MNDIIMKENINIKDKIYFVRGKQVMLDSDLAKLYEVETKRINESVKNNLEKFPERFSWRLTDIESKNLLVENFDQKNETRGGRYKNPRVFTEQGVAMLSTILKSKKAIETSIAIMDAFVEMKNYLINNNNLIEFKYINSMLLEHDNRLNILENFIPNVSIFSNQIFYDGEIYDSYSLLLDIFNDSKNNIIIIDNYISKGLLDVLSNINVNVVIYTKNIDNTLLNKYNSQYNNITIKIDNRFHDRFIIIDNKVLYHSGASFKDLGKKCFCISRIEDKEILNELLCKL